MSGKQIKLFLVDGTPGGLTTAEITTAWTGHVLAAPRSGLGGLLQRPETQRTGVYLLLGDDEAAVGETRCYIGEADVVADRLRHHHRDKDFWRRVVVVTSKDTNLTKSHGRYLESRLISLATQAARSTLENGTAPPIPVLPEADASDMEHFLSQLLIVLPVLGVNAVRVRAPQPPAGHAGADHASPVFRLVDTKASVRASAQQVDGEVIPLRHRHEEQPLTCANADQRRFLARSVPDACQTEPKRRHRGDAVPGVGQTRVRRVRRGER
ncbi:MAG: GIY-YIG nuclease family protein [Nocardioides sp.]